MLNTIKRPFKYNRTVSIRDDVLQQTTTTPLPTRSVVLRIRDEQI